MERAGELMFGKVLIANRGAIACRIIRTLRRMGVGSVAVYSDADRHSLHVEQADEAVRIGASHAAESYLSISNLLDAARQTGAEAIHPGYGFLSENAGFAAECAAAGIVFIGPTPEQIRAFGLKHTARQIASENGLSMLPGTGLLDGVEPATEAARSIGYPVMLKSTAGGGGIGMRLCASAAELATAYEAVERLSQASFGTAGLYLEKFVAKARHIEVQIFGDGAGHVIALGERDCSAQRRNQKVIEETPAPGLAADTREKLLESALRLGRAVRYQSAGTVEFIYDTDSGAFYFLEVNTRLQVEHGVTEEVTGIDLVEWMVQQAAGEWGGAMRCPEPEGCSIQVRIYAEDPARNFQPCAGQLSQVQWPRRARVETWVESGAEVTPYYDPMLGKIIVRGPDRAATLERLRAALADCRIAGIETNLEYLRQVCVDEGFAAGGITTAYLREFPYRRNDVEVVSGGTQTTIQDYPGRLGYWHVGIPPSGPMDSLAFRLANRIVGNPEGAPGLEITVTGPSLRFGCDTAIAITGADFGAKLDGQMVPRWQAMPVKAGSLLELGNAQAGGGRAYIGMAGGLEVPEYLGSRSTFILGKFGGHAGRTLRAGDVLHLGQAHASGARQFGSRSPAHLRKRMAHRHALRPARRARFLHARGHRHILLHRLEGSSQFRSNRRAAHRPQAGVGAAGRRRSGPAPLQHSRQRLRRGNHRFHGRYAGDSRAGWPQPGRLRMPRHHRAGRALEDRAAQTGRPCPFPSAVARAGDSDGAGARLRHPHAERRVAELAL